MSGCHYCGTTEGELRPYGPGGSPLCFTCMKASPEREAEAKQNFDVLLEASAAASPVGASVLTGDGPAPLLPGDQDPSRG